MSPPLAMVITLMALMYLVMSFHIVYLRFKHKVGTGDGGVKPLHQAIRVHGNFAEWVPIALFCLLAADLRGVSEGWIGGLGGLLILARLGHAVGLTQTTWTSIPRTAGVAGTVTVILLASLLTLGTL